jgi:acetate kinase
VPILVVNAGSQSVKLRVVADDDRVTAARDLGPPDHSPAAQLGEFLAEAGTIDAVGHRVVHGGRQFTAPVLVDANVRRALDELRELAPLHLPPALAAIDAVRDLAPDLPAVACFDTAFHASLPDAAAAYAVPSDWVARWGIRRYGFHGLSCAWALGRSAQLLGRSIDQQRVVVCHLGGGASVTATAGGHSVDTTMGFTPLEGLVMSTRGGDLDPGILLWALRHGLSVADLGDALEHRSGLLGLSDGRSNDLRALLAARTEGNSTATLAVSVYLHRLRAKIAAMMAATEGTDVLVFTAGVGEHSSAIRAECCAGLAWLGVAIDEPANAAVADDDADISVPDAVVRTLVIHAREELVIARECRDVLAGSLPFEA